MDRTRSPSRRLSTRLGMPRSALLGKTIKVACICLDEEWLSLEQFCDDRQDCCFPGSYPSRAPQNDGPLRINSTGLIHEARRCCSPGDLFEYSLDRLFRRSSFCTSLWASHGLQQQSGLE